MKLKHQRAWGGKPEGNCKIRGRLGEKVKYRMEVDGLQNLEVGDICPSLSLYLLLPPARRGWRTRWQSKLFNPENLLAASNGRILCPASEHGFLGDEDSANIIVTAGDGGVRFWDMRDPYRPLWCLKLVQRTAYSLAWLPDPSCVIVSIEDGTLRILSLSRVTSESPVTGKLCAEIQKQGLQNHSCSSFPIWSVHASRLTGQAVFCSSDGSVLHFQITSKSVDKDKSRYKEPHFLCGSLSEEDAVLTVNTPIPNIPYELKKSLNELGDTSRSFRSRTSDSIQAKRGHDQAPDHEALALCYNNDPSTQFDSRDTLPVSKSTVSSKMSKNRELDSNSVQGDKTPKTDKDEEAAREIEVFPPKIVSIHRVRWNMNKGSERLVCYGGAAGIVRCQEILTYSSGGRSRTLNKGRSV